MSSKIEKLLHTAKAQAESASSEQSSTASAERRFADAEEAAAAFVRLREKLLHVRRWNEHSGVNNYALFDENGTDLGDSAAEINNFICISLPGTGKNDWVKIIDFYQFADEAILTVQPSYNPTETQPDKSVTSHFFTAEATNNFCLERIDETVNFYVIGLNEKSNTADTKNLLESARNLAAANIGSLTGFQLAEWKTFCERFLY
jgi:hypothetical protein